jgi:hypothetical protein
MKRAEDIARRKQLDYVLLPIRPKARNNDFPGKHEVHSVGWIARRKYQVSTVVVLYRGGPSQGLEVGRGRAFEQFARG